MQGGISSLKDIRRGPRPKEDPAIAEMKAETERLQQALLETSIELQAMKKKESLGLKGPLFARHLTKEQREALA